MRLMRVKPFGSGLSSGHVGYLVPYAPEVEFKHGRYRRFDRGREVVLRGLDGEPFTMFKDRMRPVRYIYVGPNAEIGVPTLPVGYPERRIEWWARGRKIGVTKHLPHGTHGKTLCAQR